MPRSGKPEHEQQTLHYINGSLFSFFYFHTPPIVIAKVYEGPQDNWMSSTFNRHSLTFMSPASSQHKCFSFSRVSTLTTTIGVATNDNYFG